MASDDFRNYDPNEKEPCDCITIYSATIKQLETELMKRKLELSERKKRLEKAKNALRVAQNEVDRLQSDVKYLEEKSR